MAKPCGGRGAAATVNCCWLCGAAATVPLPDWSALMTHVPAARKPTVEPLTVQMLGLPAEKVTARPEDDVAATTYAVPVAVAVDGGVAVKVMVWLVLTGNDCGTGGAAL